MRTKELLNLQDVIGVGKGTKKVGGVDTGEPCIVVFVKKKLPKDQVPPHHLIPPVLADGQKTDVIEAGEVTALTEKTRIMERPLAIEHRQRHRPVVGGISISPGHIPLAGTAGMLVSQNGIPCILSNVHVLRPIGSERGVEAPVRQPATLLDGGRAEDEIAELLDWKDISFVEPNTIDAAIAKLTTPYHPVILGLGSPIEIAEPTPQQEVWKSGRTTGVTSGIVVAVEVEIRVGFREGIALFQNQIAATPFMLGGDSGSIWLTEDKKVVGLGFAGSPYISVANPISEVFKSFNLSLPQAIPVEELLPQLSPTTIWGWERMTRTWLRHSDAAPARFKTLHWLIPGHGYWILVEKDLTLTYNGFSQRLFKGWNLIGIR